MSSGRSRLAQTAIVSLSKTAALALLALVLAYWTWAWCAPATLLPVADAAAPPSQLIAARDLFGQARGNAQAAVPSALAINLLGIVAAEPAGSGYALLQVGTGESRVVRAGGELAPGVRVEQVLPQQVILLRNGLRETLAWPHPAQASSIATSVPPR